MRGLAIVVALVGAGFSFLAGCSSDPPSLVLRIDAAPRESIETGATLDVQVKRYVDAFQGEYFQADPIDIESAAGWPFDLLVELPTPGKYAVHLVARAGSTVYVETRCHVVEDVVTDPDVVLVPVDSTYDFDGDTFVGIAQHYCFIREQQQLSCDNDCLADEYMAISDCYPRNADMHPFAADPCGDGVDQDCFGGDPPCVGVVDGDTDQ